MKVHIVFLYGWDGQKVEGVFLGSKKAQDFCDRKNKELPSAQGKAEDYGIEEFEVQV